ncbi:hypothetical protein RMI40_31820 [Pseudomonas protegens]|uniref:hypothetical protein n=1 Tax=Pseudomonas protegens TaxID=380021 RepID=UPI00287E91AC|nr:hypothetical protein [Pseudomonas protegens]MDS9879428.1 hypothetical protein [Pseudomonas protegens]
MKNSHGPAFKVDQIDLAQCSVCRGKAFVSGVFHQLPCLQCNASGWVTADTGDALPLEALVMQLSIRLQAAEHQIAQFKCSGPAGAEAQYNENNRRGAGGTNYTGD